MDYQGLNGETADWLLETNGIGGDTPIDFDDLGHFLKHVGSSQVISRILTAAILTDIESGQHQATKLALYLGYRLARALSESQVDQVVQ